ncbi:MAG: ABC transporter substrate-binding protein, partial [Chloroflexota bacterium]|nr:ABC transporter substrate-binding protein [Chloroflexota bacterium]
MRLFVLVAILALVATACGGQDPAASGDASEEPEGSTPAQSAGGSDAPSGGELGTYTLGIFQDVTTDNVWNYNDTEGSTVWNQYLLAPTSAGAYTITYPGIEFAPDLAAGELEPTVAEGDSWVGTITLRDDVTWSDGEPLTAEDFAFTWNTVQDLELQGGWIDYTDPDVITSVEATDDVTVTVTFNVEPGLALWGPGTGITNMPIMPEHFWAPVVEEAAASDDPRTTLLAASGAEAPAIGATVFAERQEGSFAASTANENYYDAGAEKSSGEVTWTEGPYADEFQFPLYGGQEAAVLALADGEVDFLLNPLGMQRGFQDQVAENPDLTAIVNPTNGYRFLAFNHSRAPMSDPAFRDALTALINKEFVTENLLQGVAFPLYVILPEGNIAWYNEEVATELAEQGYAGLDDLTRQQTAIDILTEAGYTWETAPTIEDETFTAGSGLIGPDGEPVGQLELIVPTASYDPLRATFGNYISGVAQAMGINLVAIPTDFNKIVNDVFALDEDNNYTSPFDMFILGYSLGNAAFPTFHCSFFCTGGDSNNTQYSNEDYDAAADAFDAALTEEDA